MSTNLPSSLPPNAPNGQQFTRREVVAALLTAPTALSALPALPADPSQEAQLEAIHAEFHRCYQASEQGQPTAAALTWVWAAVSSAIQCEVITLAEFADAVQRVLEAANAHA